MAWILKIKKIKKFVKLAKNRQGNSEEVGRSTLVIKAIGSIMSLKCIKSEW